MCFGLWGPRARQILAPLTRDDVTNEGFPFLTAREITVGNVPVLALRVTYVGELGWELYAPTEYGRALWDALWEAGRPHGLVAAGYRAIDALRLEKGYRVWSSDITPDETPFDAGLGFAVALDKGTAFLGRDALIAAKAAGPRKRLRCLVLDEPRSVCLGNEPVRVGGEIVGRVTSGGYGFAVERSIAYAYLPPDGADREPGRGRGLRRMGRLRGRARAAVGPGRRADPRMTATTFGAEWSASLRRGTDAELRGWLEVAMAACDEADVIARRHFRRDLTIETKPDRTFVTQADTAIERHDPRAPARRVPGSRPGRRGVRHRRRRRVRPLVHRPDRRDPQLHPRRPRVRDAPRRRARRGAPGGGPVGARARRAVVGASGRRCVGAEPGRERHGGSTCRGISALDDAQLLYGSRPRHRRLRPRAGLRWSPPIAVWRERGFGDFWGYALVAEGAAEAMVEVGTLVLGRGGADGARRGGRRSGHGLRWSSGDRRAGPSSRVTASCTRPSVDACSPS